MPNVSSALRAFRKLGSMPPREVGHRLRERVYMEMDRLRAGKPLAAALPPRDFKQYLMEHPRRRFYRGPGEASSPIVEAAFPDLRNRAAAEANALCAHRLELFGSGPLDLGPQIDWHRDPVSGAVWERRYWADYRPVQDPFARDIKGIHELNRHQHLPRLAKAFALTGDERFAAEAVRQLTGWIEQNPPGLGVNWQSSLEIGIRAISWLWTLFPILSSESLDGRSAQVIAESLFVQLEHVRRYPSAYTSPNTHLIGEAAALFIAGFLFKDCEVAAEWMDWGAVTLARELEKQVYADGVYRELSTSYHCYALDFFLQAMVLAELNGYAFPGDYREGVCQMLEFVMHMTRPDGSLPLIGDDDGGRVLGLARRNYRCFQDGLCVGAVLHRRGDFKQQSGGFAEEAFWYLGADAWETFNAISATPPAAESAVFADAGYVIARTGWGPLDSHLVFDRGDMGMLAGGHAHADALSINLFAGGRELLVDPGTCVYNGAPGLRNYFRSTRAHNSVTVDGLDQVQQAGTFSWNTRLRVDAAGPLSLPGVSYLSGWHDGYARLAHAVTHRRRVIDAAPHYWLLIDDFRGTGEHAFDWRFHFAAGIALGEAEHDCRHVGVRSHDTGVRLSLYGSVPFESAAVLRGEEDEIEGWVSAGYGTREPAPVLHVRAAGGVPVVAITSIVAFSDLQARPLELDRGEGLAQSYRFAEYEDLVVASSNDQPIEIGDLRMRGEFFWLRRERGEVKQFLAVHATYLEAHGSPLFRRSVPEDYCGLLTVPVSEKTLCAESVGS